MKKNKNYLIFNKKYLFAVTYSIIAGMFFFGRNRLLYSHIPAIQSFPMAVKVLDVILMTVAVIGLIALIQCLRCPPHIKRNFNNVCRNHNIKNCTNKFPKLRSVIPCGKHKYIYSVHNKDITRTMFMDKAEALQQALDIHIIDIRVCKRGKITEFFVVPNKYYKPAEITLDNENLGSNITVDNLINAVVCGNTGSGKTVFMKALMAKISKYQPSASFHILDFKNYDFKEFSDCPLYYSYKDCVRGMENFYNHFKKQQDSGIVPKEPQYLVIDEWAAFVTSLDKKVREDMISKFEELIMLGRVYNYRLLVGVQRADSIYFGSARMNFKCRIAMGNLDPEGKRMLFSGYTELMNEQNDTGEGYLLVDGKGIERIKVVIKDFEKLDKMAGKAMGR